MHLTIDENEQQHIYSCLLVGATEFGKVKKTLAKLDRDDPEIDEQIALNGKLKRMFNPRAEEEARSASRKDDAQLDLTNVASSGETGGGIPAGQTFSLKTPADMTNEELRDALLELGLAVALDTIEAWVDAEFEADVNAVESWIEQARTALANGEALPDEPMLLARDSIPVSRLRELLDAGPWVVTAQPNVEQDEEATTDYTVCRESSDVGDGLTDTDTIFPDKLDAEIRAARLNRTELQRSGMSDDEILEWAGKGPWIAEGKGGDGENGDWSIVAGSQRESCESDLDAMGRAARYNRSIANRAVEPVEPMYEIVDETVESEQPVEAVAGSAE